MSRSIPDSILLVSSDRRLIEAISSLNAPTGVRALPCLRALPAHQGRQRIVLDPREFSQCCLEGAVRLGRRFGRATLSAISHPTLHAPLLEITENRPIPGAWSCPTNRRRRASNAEMNPRQAWRSRETLFDAGRQDGLVGRFLELTLAHRAKPYSVEDAAADLGSSPRQLERCCSRALGYSPGFLINMARIMSVAEDLSSTDRQIDKIAFQHGFHDAATMSRQFLRVTGERPGAYRASRVRIG